MATTLANISIKDSSSWNTYLNLIYPIGSYYLSNTNTSPGSRFGGTWTQIKDQRFLCGYTSITTGGANTVTLTVNEMPKHHHRLRDIPPLYIANLDTSKNQILAEHSTSANYCTYDDKMDDTGGARVTKTDPYSALVLCGTELLRLFTSKGGE